MSTTLSNQFTILVQNPPLTGISSPGSKLDINSFAGSQLIDKDKAIWTTKAQISGVAGQIGLNRNGVGVAQSVDFAVIDTQGVVWNSDFKSGSGWERWTGVSWVASQTPPVIA